MYRLIFPSALLLTFISIVLLLLRPQTGMLFAIFAKPIVSMSWSHEVFFGLSALEIMGVIVPTILLIRMLVFAADRPRKMRYAGAWLLYIFANILGYSLIAANGQFMNAIAAFFKMINGFVAFYVYQVYFSERENFRKLLIVYLIAGLVPLFLGLYEASTGHQLREGIYEIRTGAEGVIRISGYYQNAITYKMIGYFTLTSILLYWCYFARHTLWSKILLGSYTVVCLIVIYNIYSKGAILTILVWFLIWTMSKKSFGWLVSIIMLMFVFNFVTGNMIAEDVATTFSHETAAVEGEEDVDRMFQGRVGMVKYIVNEWLRRDFVSQVFGWGELRGGHNDFARALATTGVFGLISYLLLLGILGKRIMVNARKNPMPLNVVALMIFVAWIADALGRDPSQWIEYQWWAWGFMGLAVYGVRGLSTDRQSDSLRKSIELGPDTSGTGRRILRKANGSARRIN